MNDVKRTPSPTFTEAALWLDRARDHLDAHGGNLMELAELLCEVHGEGRAMGHPLLQSALDTIEAFKPLVEAARAILVARVAASRLADPVATSAPFGDHTANPLNQTPRPIEGEDRTCEFCGCNTNSRQRRCCAKGEQADKDLSRKRMADGLDQSLAAKLRAALTEALGAWERLDRDVDSRDEVRREWMRGLLSPHPKPDS